MIIHTKSHDESHVSLIKLVEGFSDKLRYNTLKDDLYISMVD